MTRVVAIVAQLLALVVLNRIGYAVAAALPVPLPGNLLGMLFLFALLVSGLVPLRWTEPTASLLTRHLAFFFIPITVGLVTFADLLMADGPAILVILVVSAAVGICAAGFCAQRLAARADRRSA